MPTAKNNFCFETPKQTSISDILQESFDNRFGEIPPEIEDAIEELIAEQMASFHSSISFTLEELVDLS